MVSKYQGKDHSYNPFADAYFYSSTTAPPIEEKSIYLGTEEVSKEEQIAIEMRLSKALFDFITSGSIENRPQASLFFYRLWKITKI